MVRVTKPAAPPPAPKAQIVTYTFPTMTEVNKQENFSINVKNVGGDGNIYIGIGNESSNPGDIIINISGIGVETKIIRGDLYLIAGGYVRSGGTLSASGYVKFTVDGSYKIRLEAGTYSEYDYGAVVAQDTRIVNVIVAKPAPPPPPPAPPPMPKGQIVTYNFPTMTEVNKAEAWSITAKNVGGAGYIHINIYNEQGNPGAIVVTLSGNNYTINPGYAIMVANNNVPAGGTLSSSGSVKFTVEGSYNIRLEAAHYEGYKEVIDDYRIVDG